MTIALIITGLDLRSARSANRLANATPVTSNRARPIPQIKKGRKRGIENFDCKARTMLPSARQIKKRTMALKKSAFPLFTILPLISALSAEYVPPAVEILMPSCAARASKS